jgi:UDP-N-acetylglucosamine--N-acetylmuramyl-(pentapeptide) pyrophosphoryl-undecaprenol N-acetylglucosamine transferase
MNEKRIVFTGGGTGGHIFPLIAVAREASRLMWQSQAQFSLYYLGPVEGPFPIPLNVFESAGIEIRPIRSSNLVEEGMGKIASLWRLFRGILAAFWHLWLLMPDVIFSKGGWGAVPVLIVARIYRIPVLLHESDTIPGRVNERAGKWATRIALSFESTKKYFPMERTAVSGNPVRLELGENTNREKAISLFHFDAGKKTILILGGSQGAKTINDIVLDLLEELASRHQIIHQCGIRNYDEVLKEVNFIFDKMVRADIRSSYKLYGFLDLENLRDAYSIADLVISRAGSGLIFELALLGKPAILVPLSASSRNHQRENAYQYAKTDAAEVLEEENLKPHLIMRQIETLLSNPQRLERMAAAARSFARPEAALIIAQELLRLCGLRPRS